MAMPPKIPRPRQPYDNGDFRRVEFIERGHFLCPDCGRLVPYGHTEVDHVASVWECRLRGEIDPNMDGNRQLLCRDCNRRKSSLLLEDYIPQRENEEGSTCRVVTFKGLLAHLDEIAPIQPGDDEGSDPSPEPRISPEQPKKPGGLRNMSADDVCQLRKDARNAYDSQKGSYGNRVLVMKWGINNGQVSLLVHGRIRPEDGGPIKGIDYAVEPKDDSQSN